MVRNQYVQVDRSLKPAYVKEGQETNFIFAWLSTQPLTMKESIEYIQGHWRCNVYERSYNAMNLVDKKL
jgi:hypothetical protein